MSTATSRGGVAGNQRYRKGLVCPICGGSEDDDRGQGVRCFGFIGADGLYAHCSREERAGGIAQTPGSETFPHRLNGPCKCGVEHAPALPKIPRPRRAHSPIEAVYEYRDEAGTLLFEVVRRQGKSFAQRRPAEIPGTWIWSLAGVRRVLYRLPELLAADPSRPVFVTEGEKDADRLRESGLVATCNPGGAGKWSDDYTRTLSGRTVYVIADHDDAGRDHARQVAGSLAGTAAVVDWLDLADVARDLGLGELPGKGDASDFLAMGGTVEALERAFVQAPTLKIVRDDEPAGQPPGPDPAELPRFGNHHVEEYVDPEGRTKLRPVPHPMRDIAADLAGLSPGWPKRVGERLFAERDREPIYLGSSTRLFSWIDQRSHVDWTKGSRFITQERFYEYHRMNADRYDSIETLPHVPAMPGAYYMHRDMPEPSGKLDELIARFLPATETDRQLIKALIVTPLWGGMPGTRPAFLVTGPDFDPDQGRGLGKSSMLDLIADDLYGGSIDVSPGEDDMGAVKTRLLSDAGSSKRIMRLDNVKTLRFSWADLEALISSTEISGRMLYVGEGRRKNDLVWIVTLNGASLSKDMAQRVVTIKLARPPVDRDPKWREETSDFMREHRWDILSDVARTLAREPGPLTPKTRWAAWERDVLSKLADPESCQRAMIERQETIDEGNSDRDTVRDALHARISEHGYDPDEALLKIPSKTMAEIVSDATRKHYETGTATTFVKALGIVELVLIRTNSFRGWIWNGCRTEESDPVLFSPIPRKT